MSKAKFFLSWHGILITSILLVIISPFVLANAEEFAEAKKIIDAKTPCLELTEGQLEILGDYLMEQMNPGDAHEAMDKMMGGEGSKSLILMHIAMAERIYCNDINSSIDYGFYGMMGMGYGNGMMRGLKDNYPYTRSGMMGVYGGMRNMMGYNFGYGYGGLLNFLTTILLVGLVILVYLWIIKLWKQISKKEK